MEMRSQSLQPKLRHHQKVKITVITGSPRKNGNTFAMVIPMERTAALLKWDIVGEVLVPGVFVEGDINNTDGCAQAAALADKF